MLYRSTLQRVAQGKLGRAALYKNVGIHELSTSDVYSTHVAMRLVGSYPAFSPLPTHACGRLFSSTLIHPCGRLPVKKQNALCCPDFPPTPLVKVTPIAANATCATKHGCTRQASQLILK